MRRASIRWLDEEQLSLDVCSGGELALALRAGFPAQRIALHGSNKSGGRTARRSTPASASVVVDSFYEIARLAASDHRAAGPDAASR